VHNVGCGAGSVLLLFHECIALANASTLARTGALSAYMSLEEKRTKMNGQSESRLYVFKGISLSLPETHFPIQYHPFFQNALFYTICVLVRIVESPGADSCFSHIQTVHRLENVFG